MKLREGSLHITCPMTVPRVGVMSPGTNDFAGKYPESSPGAKLRDPAKRDCGWRYERDWLGFLLGRSDFRSYITCEILKILSLNSN